MKLISQSFLKKAASGKKILVDTNIVIYLTDDIQPYAALSRQLFEMIETGDAHAVFSIVSIAEVMQGPLRKGLNRIAMDVRDYLMTFPNSTCQEINIEVIENIGNDQRINWQKLRAIDSLIIASGLVHEVDRIISNDTHFRQALPGDLLLAFDETMSSSLP